MKTKEESETISLDQLSLAFTCRTCLNTDSRQLLIPIFKDHKASGKSPFDLFDQLLFLKLKISLDDGFPANICSKCMERLAAVNAFRTQCEKAQEFLVRYFAELPEEQPECKQEVEYEYTDFEFLAEPVNAGRLEDDGHEQQEGPLEEEEKNLHCPICGKEYKRGVNLERHLATHDQSETVPLAEKTASSSNVYGCLKCGKRFKKLETLSQHKENGKCVSHENPKCRYCHELCTSLEELEAHLEESHPKDRPHVCPLCKKTFQSVSNRNTHLLLHNQNGSVKCDHCEQEFKSKVYLNRHKKAMHTFGNHTCPYCRTVFTNTNKFEYHLKSHDPNKKYKCRYCTKSFLQQHHLLNHERIHTGKRPYLCNVCGKGFKHEPSFKTHLKIHEGVRSHVCEICSKNFVQRSTYIQHMAKHKNIRAFQCEQCGKDFVQRAALLTHLRTHSGELPFQCTSCDKSFAQARQLKYHNFTVHNGPPAEDDRQNLELESKPAEENRSMQNPIEEATTKQVKPTPKVKILPYDCKLCNKCFKLPSSLTSHMKIHKEERKHVCKDCGNTFKRAEHLRVHINGVHLKRKPFSCEVCHKAFSQSGDRNVHMRRHMNEKPHQCTFCGKGFSLAKALRAHVRLHTGEKPFLCIICNMSFISYTALASHTQKHQEEDQLNSETLVEKTEQSS